jgi:hypothetical protein
LTRLLKDLSRSNDAKAFFESALAELEKGRPNRRVNDMKIDLYDDYAELLNELGEKEKADQMEAKADALEKPDRHGPPHHPPGGGHGPPPGPHRGPRPPEHPRGPGGKPSGDR